MGEPARKVKARATATIEDLLAIPEDKRWHEIIDGELVRKAMPSFAHGRGQNRLGSRIGDPYDRPSGRRGPGGWWILTDVEVELAPEQVYRPDLVGFRRERVPTPPPDWPIRVRPDWVCEILSPSNATNDTLRKFRNYHRYEIPHYWILDPVGHTLFVHRWAADGYLVVATAEAGERIHAEPFDAVELDIDELFGDIAEEEPATEG